MVQFSIDLPDLKSVKVMVYNPGFTFQENEGLRIDHSAVCIEIRALRTENSALRSKVNSQNICAVCGNDSQSSTVSDHPDTCTSIALLCARLLLKMFSFNGNASINSSGAHPPPGNRGAFAHVVSPGGWALAYPGAIPGHLTHVFSKDG